MTMETAKPNRLQQLGSTLFLGFLVTALTVFTAATNYATYVAGGRASALQTEGDRLLADSNTEYIQANQYIILDYTMYDGYYVNLGKDPDASRYYEDNFSDILNASIARGSEFDDQYYNESYATADEKFNEAFAKFDEANIAGEREVGFQVAMLIAAVGLAFAAYASLLDKASPLRGTFALMSLILLIFSIGQFAIVLLG